MLGMGKRSECLTDNETSQSVEVGLNLRPGQLGVIVCDCRRHMTGIRSHQAVDIFSVRPS